MYKEDFQTGNDFKVEFRIALADLNEVIGFAVDAGHTISVKVVNGKRKGKDRPLVKISFKEKKKGK